MVSEGRKRILLYQGLRQQRASVIGCERTVKKNKYNQGDLLQYQSIGFAPVHICVITEVYDRSDKGLGYEVCWFSDLSKERCYINTIDDDKHVKLLARGQ
jgi:hypothetical protein